jgi:hypothetical protein
MSDGPHRSLPMRKGWKRVVERADRDASTEEDIVDALPEALYEDCRSEMPREMLRDLENLLTPSQQTSLLDDDLSTAVTSLRRLVAGYPLAQLFLDCAADAAGQSKKSDIQLINILARTLEDRALRGARQAEEHYKKRTSALRASSIRARLEQAISRISFVDIATNILRGQSAPSKAIKQHGGLDDGVRLP